MRIILDTNFLLIPGQFGVDIFEEIDRIANFPYTLHVVSATIAELERLMGNQRQKVVDRRAAKLALDLLKKYPVNIMPVPEEVLADDSIVEIAKGADILVATNDRELIARLKRLCVRIIRLRQKKLLTIVG